jgi:hypothetical protein
VVGGGIGGIGGGVFNGGTLAIKNSRVIHNTATALGGGIYNCIEGQVSETIPRLPCHGTMTLKHTVVTENTPDDIVP